MTTTYGSAWAYVAAQSSDVRFVGMARNITGKQASVSYVRIGDIAQTVANVLDDVVQEATMRFVQRWTALLESGNLTDSTPMPGVDRYGIVVGDAVVYGIFVTNGDVVKRLTVSQLMAACVRFAAKREFPDVRRCASCRDASAPCRTCVGRCAGTGATVTDDEWSAVADSWSVPTQSAPDALDVRFASLTPKARKALKAAVATVVESGQSVVASNGKPATAVWEAYALECGASLAPAAVREARERLLGMLRS